MKVNASPYRVTSMGITISLEDASKELGLPVPETLTLLHSLNMPTLTDNGKTYARYIDVALLKLKRAITKDMETHD